MHTLVHPVTEKELEALVSARPHAVYITGPKGIGLTQIAKEFTDRIKATYLYLEPAESVISVDQIRDLYQLTRGRKTKPQVIMLPGEYLTAQAQHVFLKLLEEPPANTIFLITGHDPSALIGTVRSRMQLLTVRPISEQQSTQLIEAHSSNINAQKKAQLLFLAKGLPAELTRILDNTAYFDDRVAQMKRAQQFILSDRYNRLVLLQVYIKNRAELQGYIHTITKLLQHDIYQKKQLSEKHIELLERLEYASAALVYNANVKLIAAQLVL